MNGVLFTKLHCYALNNKLDALTPPVVVILIIILLYTPTKSYIPTYVYINYIICPSLIILNVFIAALLPFKFFAVVRKSERIMCTIRVRIILL